MTIFNLFRKKEEQEIDFKLVRTITGDFNNFKERIKNSSLIFLIIGKRGSGKTALGFKFLEVLSDKRKAYYLGNAKLPWWISQVDNIEKIILLF